jgi:phage shock protein A
MLHLITTLARGAVADVETAVFDANAIRILEQQLRDAASALEQSRRELACAMAHQASEERAVASLQQRIDELETSGRKAIEGGREDLAEEVAIEIAATEDERNERRDAAGRVSSEIKRLKLLVDDGRKRLLDLRRGLELARAQEALRRAGANGRRAIAAGKGALREAEGTLARIRATHAKEQDVGAALEELDGASSGRDLDARLDKAGFGTTQKTKAADVLNRLRATPAAGTSTAARKEGGSAAPRREQP